VSDQPPKLPQQAGLRTFLQVGGPVVAGIGLIFTIAGMADFFSSFGSFAPPTNFWMVFIGMPMLAVGLGMMRIGYLGPATRYVAGEVAPTVKDTLAYLGVGAAEGQVKCPACGGASPTDASFCNHCGAPLGVVCASCGHRNAPGASFCDHCAKPLTRPDSAAS